MFKVYYGKNSVLHNPLLEDTLLHSAKVSLELNTAGMFEFTIELTHPLYDALEEYGDTVYVFDGDELIFAGPICQVSYDFNKSKVVTCEGRLSYLADAVVYPYSVTTDKNLLLERFLLQFNAAVGEHDPEKMIDISKSSISIPNGSSDRINSNEDYSTVWEEISRIVEKYGGYIFWKVGNPRTDEEYNYIEYVPALTEVSNQPIEFGKNLISLTNSIDLSELATVIIPIGSEGLTVESVIQKNYIVNETMANRYGYKWAVVTWDDVEDASALLAVAYEYINQNAGIRTIEISAVDLAFISEGREKWRIGQNIHIISKPHGLDSYFQLSKMEIDINDISNNTITLGQTLNTLTGKIVSNI